MEMIVMDDGWHSMDDGWWWWMTFSRSWMMDDGWRPTDDTWEFICPAWFSTRLTGWFHVTLMDDRRQFMNDDSWMMNNSYGWRLWMVDDSSWRMEDGEWWWMPIPSRIFGSQQNDGMWRATWWFVRGSEVVSETMPIRLAEWHSCHI